MKLRIIALEAVVLLAGCTGNNGTPATMDAGSVDGGGTMRFRLTQESLFPGCTNASATPVLKLRGHSMRGTTATDLRANLEGNLAFVSADGQEKIAAVVRFQNATFYLAPSEKEMPEVSATSGDFLFSVEPAAPLQSGRWYDVRYTEMLTADLSSDDAYNLGVGVFSRFYTSSAPQLRKLDWVKKAGVQERYLLVQMSEPVNLQDILSGGIVASPMSGGCVIWDGKCRQIASEGSVVSGFEYRFTSDVATIFELKLALSLRGVANTVGESMDQGAVRGATTSDGQFLLYGMDATSWPQRRSTIVGWSNAEQ